MSQSMPITDYFPQDNQRVTDVATSLVTSGGYVDATGTWVPTPFAPSYPGPNPWVDTANTLIISNGSCCAPEKPHETVKRATAEIAAAARDLLASVEAMGMPMSDKDLHDAILKRVKDALKG